MSLREKLASLAIVIADEAERNSGFRRQLEAALASQQPGLLAVDEDKGGADVHRKGGRRTPSVIDPLVLARQGEDILRQELSRLDIEQLKDVVAQYGMDPGKLVMKWKDAGRIIHRIVELSLARSTKGDAFRAERPDTPKAAP
jgi:hypothetical protein